MNPGEASLPSGTPAAEVNIDTALVSALLAEQHPDLAHLPLQAVAAGWDNALFRLGEKLAIRLPRRAASAPLIAHEQTWLPRMAARLPLPIPTPYRVGTPTGRYPWRWSVVPWLHGNAADQHQPDASQARPFAAFLRSLHVPAPADAPPNPVRGVPLRERADAVEARMRRLAHTGLITPRIWQLWQEALDAPLDLAPTWLHGDLHPRNVLVEQGSISAVVDWGDITSGDPATDLASIWMLFADSSARQEAFAHYAALSEAALRRTNGWAVLFGVVLLDTGLIDNPRNATIGEQTLRRLASALV